MVNFLYVCPNLILSKVSAYSDRFVTVEHQNLQVLTSIGGVGRRYSSMKHPSVGLGGIPLIFLPELFEP